MEQYVLPLYGTSTNRNGIWTREKKEIEKTDIISSQPIKSTNATVWSQNVFRENGWVLAPRFRYVATEERQDELLFLLSFKQNTGSSGEIPGSGVWMEQGALSVKSFIINIVCEGVNGNCVGEV